MRPILLVICAGGSEVSLEWISCIDSSTACQWFALPCNVVSATCSPNRAVLRICHRRNIDVATRDRRGGSHNAEQSHDEEEEIEER